MKEGSVPWLFPLPGSTGIDYVEAALDDPEGSAILLERLQDASETFLGLGEHETADNLADAITFWRQAMDDPEIADAAAEHAQDQAKDAADRVRRHRFPDAVDPGAVMEEYDRDWRLLSGTLSDTDRREMAKIGDEREPLTEDDRDELRRAPREYRELGRADRLQRAGARTALDAGHNRNGGPGR